MNRHTVTSALGTQSYTTANGSRATLKWPDALTVTYDYDTVIVERVLTQFESNAATTRPSISDAAEAASRRTVNPQTRSCAMNREFGNAYYSTQPVTDNREGYAGLELFRTVNGEKSRAARIRLWDSSGEFFFETFNTDLPLQIVEELIVEARSVIKTR